MSHRTSMFHSSENRNQLESLRHFDIIHSIIIENSEILHALWLSKLFEFHRNVAFQQKSTNPTISLGFHRYLFMAAKKSAWRRTPDFCRVPTPKSNRLFPATRRNSSVNLMTILVKPFLQACCWQRVGLTGRTEKPALEITPTTNSTNTRHLPLLLIYSFKFRSAFQPTVPLSGMFSCYDWLSRV